MGRPQEKSRGMISLAPLLGLGLLLEGGLLLMTALVYRLPETFHNVYGHSPATLPLFLAGRDWAPAQSTSPQAFQWAFIGLWLGLHIVWLLALRWVSRETTHSATLVLLLTMTLLFNLTLTLAMPPLFTTDILNYLSYGRMAVFHGLNPYTTTPSAMVSDPILDLAFWDILSPYGPLWVGISAIVARLAGYSGILGGLLMLKGLAGLSHLALSGLLFALSHKSTQATAGLSPTAIALGVAWSPLFLLEGAGQGHNDLVMLALAMAGLLAFRRNRPWIGYLLLLLSVLVKAVSILLLAFAFLAWLCRQEGLRERVLLLGKAALLGLAVLLIAILPFWDGPQPVFTALLGETTRIRVSPVVFLLRGLEQFWMTWPATAPRAENLAFLTTQALLKGLLLIVMVVQGILLWRRHQGKFLPMLEAWERVALLFVCFLHGATFPWYFSWPASTALLGTHRPTQRRLAGLSFGLGTFTGLFYGVPI